MPGVGAFEDAAAGLRRTGLDEAFCEAVRAGKPCLGVCLGLQLLFDASEEDGLHQGLGLLPGKVVEVKDSPRLPVIGWCRLAKSDEAVLWSGIKDRAYFYFVHSFTPESSDCAIAWSEFSPAAAAVRGNVMGTQFHPEKSGPDGLRVYENFLAFCGGG